MLIDTVCLHRNYFWLLKSMEKKEEEKKIKSINWCQQIFQLYNYGLELSKKKQKSFFKKDQYVNV